MVIQEPQYLSVCVCVCMHSHTHLNASKTVYFDCFIFIITAFTFYCFIFSLFSYKLIALPVYFPLNINKSIHWIYTMAATTAASAVLSLFYCKRETWQKPCLTATNNTTTSTTTMTKTMRKKMSSTKNAWWLVTFTVIAINWCCTNSVQFGIQPFLCVCLCTIFALSFLACNIEVCVCAVRCGYMLLLLGYVYFVAQKKGSGTQTQTWSNKKENVERMKENCLNAGKQSNVHKTISELRWCSLDYSFFSN